jgi:AraC-like DNA-binding protein
MQFFEHYHRLATPLTDIFFSEKENCGEWLFTPVPHPDIGAGFYRFLVELHLGILMSLHCDIMGPSFTPRELHVSFPSTNNTPAYSRTLGCPVFYGRPQNKFIFAATWLEGAPAFGNKVTYPLMLRLCDQLMNDMQLRLGVAGKVREALVMNLTQPRAFDTVARKLHMVGRTLRRKLREENTSFRKIKDEVRLHMACEYLRDTNLTIEDIAFSLGFSDPTNFRQAFRRWTQSTPTEFRHRVRTLRAE